jgi:hypothetical protein
MVGDRAGPTEVGLLPVPAPTIRENTAREVRAIKKWSTPTNH